MRYTLAVADGSEVVVDFYRGKREFPTVVVLPILSGRIGRAPVAKFIAWLFRAQGWSTCIVYRPDDLFDVASAKEFNAKLDGLIGAHRRVVSWLQENANDPNKLVAIGVSLGGIIAAGLACLIPEYKAVAALMAGGPLSNVIMDSRENGVVRFRKAMLQTRSRERLFDELNDDIQIEPYKLASQRTVPLLLVRSKFDRDVPTYTQDELRARMRGHSTAHMESFGVLSGHYTIALWFPFIIGRIQMFYWERIRSRGDG